MRFPAGEFGCRHRHALSCVVDEKFGDRTTTGPIATGATNWAVVDWTISSASPPRHRPRSVLRRL